MILDGINYSKSRKKNNGVIMASQSFKTTSKQENANLVRKFRKLGFNVKNVRTFELSTLRSFMITLTRKPKNITSHIFIHCNLSLIKS
jgi:hypothetical protein